MKDLVWSLFMDQKEFVVLFFPLVEHIINL